MKGDVTKRKQYLRNSFFTGLSFFTSLVLFLSFTFYLTSCSDDDPVSSPVIDLSEQIEKFSFYTEYFPPFNFDEDGTKYGVSVEILDEIFKKMNVNLSGQDVTIAEWSQAFQATLDTENTMLFSTVRNTERESLFKWVGPIAPHKEILIALKSRNVVINNQGEISNFKIGVIEGYSSIQLLESFGVGLSDLSIVKNVNELYSLLDNGTVDCIAYSEIAHGLIVNALQLGNDNYETSYVMSVSELYYAFNKNTSDDIINYFQETLNELVNNKGADGVSIYDKIISTYNIINESDDGITDKMVTNLVNQTSDDITADAGGTLAKINNSENPYRDANIPALYTFVYDTTLTVVAHATNSLIVGATLKGKPDVSGKLFRDEILAGALTNGSGWVDYIYTKPDESGLYYKTTYYKLTTGSNGELYIVCAGKYR